MPYKDPVKQKQAQNESYLRNKERVLARNRARKQKVKAKVYQYKLQSKCKYCEFDNPLALDFHHHNNDKYKSVSVLVAYGCSWKRVKIEIDKCIVLCANCHRIEHSK